MVRKNILAAIVLIIPVSFLFGFILKEVKNKNHSQHHLIENEISVVELFTSEGCSSCPPADKLFSDLKSAMDGKPVFFLAYHVDYWNHLGWKDRFSDAAFSRRQQAYAEVLNTNVYTPMMIINGRKAFVGSDRAEANSSITNALSNSNASYVQIQVATNIANDKVNIHFKTIGNLKDAVLNIAVVQKEASSVVSKGENRGRKLNHVNVVRSFVTVAATEDGNESISFPSELKNQIVSIVCFTQNKNSLAVMSAVQQDVFLGEKQ